MNQELKSALPALAVLGALSVGALLFNTYSTKAPLPSNAHAPTEKRVGRARTIMVHSSNWAFEPSTIRVKQGEQVSLHLMGIQGDHGLSIPELGINETMSQGEVKMVKIPTDKPGSYDFYCNVSCGRGHSDMRGTLIIES